MTMTRGPGDTAAQPPLALTMGEPAGIGGEITLMAWRERTRRGVPSFFVIDDPDRLRRLGESCGLRTPVTAISAPGEAAAAFGQALPVLPEPLGVEVTPGRPDPRNAPSVIRAIDRAVKMAAEGAASAIVTNPIHKTTLYEAGFPHPGHTEYLAELAGAGASSVMMLACDALRVVPVTVHLSLRQAIEALTTDAIVHCGRVTAAALATDFGVDRPRLAVAGLNPHAGEDGHMGREEIDIIAPAIARLRAEGITIGDPAPADTLFHAAARMTYDAVLCMYHDQALIPLKTIDFAGGVNVTLGLPFIRTSPDHGTAFSIAGTGKASPDSLIAALRMASLLARNRRRKTVKDPAIA
jgi:4-hydroxythreonine-4-phosphate dehydrogenase